MAPNIVFSTASVRLRITKVRVQFACVYFCDMAIHRNVFSFILLAVKKVFKKIITFVKTSAKMGEGVLKADVGGGFGEMRTSATFW